ncbi:MULTISPECIES: transcriptional repressor LexA [Pseudothermotoga]|jgi:repressor LexA|uniref:LexA repressor n=1 Tax=Pseudothermotoga lettingae (strain ATCC BAA-301 / DSM 14385 / NBRC 107922 / TMO) TaxID=416591 RepID=LEXA_PSELT|nr:MULTISPECIES: transcriptional repressor LexA [Pseudothermotoga]A8F429.1 RecName: Full=LexA repressor [Pseudothermotoga lettingae TMO]ABV32913.1 SOS-response transcriptional repressor, LexA [Pseudothermotoga lettingae TMO]KUK21798.1 MAG: LexA repressor [Pseudothermotoga lettingae]MDI3494021.1 repressor LexA [Pseudothermotoga sp.]MDK2884963.1 repressor LexA [Pseudothermotoga sp.]GLI48088.1 lexA repressor [Pseudothermotoga lettingae TMO]
MKKELTDRQKKILDFVLSYIDSHGYPPSIRDIARAFRITPRGAIVHLNALEKKGYLTRGKRARSIKVLNRSEAIRLPVVGTIAAGNAIEAIENPTEIIEVPKAMIKIGFDHFLLRVRGESMIEEHILDKDYVVIRKQNTANNGDIVAVLTNSNEATLKKIYIEPEKIILKPANSKMQPIELKPENVKILGKMVGVIRIYG